MPSATAQNAIAEHVEDRKAIERPGLAPVGVGFAGEAVRLRHEQVLDRVVVAAGAAQPDHLPGVGDGRLRFREQHGALLERLAVRAEPRLAVRLADGGVAAEPLRMPAAAGELPVPGHAIAAVGDDRLGAGRGRAGGDRRARIAEQFARHLRARDRPPPSTRRSSGPGTRRRWRRRLATASITWKKVAGSTSSPPMSAGSACGTAAPSCMAVEHVGGNFAGPARSGRRRPRSAARGRAPARSVRRRAALVGGACCGRYAIQHACVPSLTPQP